MRTFADGIAACNARANCAVKALGEGVSARAGALSPDHYKKRKQKSPHDAALTPTTNASISIREYAAQGCAVLLA